MNGNLEPEENVLWDENGLMDLVQETIDKLNWDQENDDIVVEIGGTSVSGIDVGEVYNKKWQSPKGTVKYNRDAFIVVKNLTRSPIVPSEPNPDLIAHHLNPDNNEETTDSTDSSSNSDTDSSPG